MKEEGERERERETEQMAVIHELEITYIADLLSKHATPRMLVMVAKLHVQVNNISGNRSSTIQVQVTRRASWKKKNPDKFFTMIMVYIIILV